MIRFKSIFKINPLKCLCILFIAFSSACFGQNFSVNLVEYKKKYDTDLVTLNKTTDVTIAVEEDKIEINKTVTEDIYYLNQFANRYNYVSLNYEEAFYGIFDIEAYALRPEENGKYKKIKVAKEDISTKKIMSSHVFYDGEKAKEFYFPSLQEGAISHLQYTEATKDPHFFGRFFFADLHPIENQKLTITVENGIVLNFTYFNGEVSDFEFSKTTKGKNTIYTWKQKHIPALQLPDKGPGFVELAPHIVIRIVQYKNKTGKTIPVYSDVSDLFRWNASFLDSTKNVDMIFAQKLIDSIVPKNSSKKEVVSQVYKWVQNNISYIAIENGLGGFMPRSPKKVYLRRYGDCKDMTCLLVHLLQAAHIDAHYVWIGTREIPYNYTQVPMSLSQNHMIVAWKDNNQYVFLDPTSEEMPFGYPSDFIQSKTALIYLGENKFDTATVPVVPASKNKLVNTISFNIDSGKIVGNYQSKGYVYFSNIMKGIEQISYLDKTEKKWESWFRLGNNSFEILPNSVYVEKGDTMTVNCQFKLDNYVVKVGDEMFINPILDRAWNGKIVSDDRKYAYKYNFQYKVDYKYEFEVPKGYNVKFIPKGDSANFSQFSYKVSYKQADENKIIAHYMVEIKSLFLKPSHFDSWNEFSKKISAITSQSIILKKQ